MDFLSAAVMLFLILDPLGNIPVFNTVLEGLPAEQRWRVILRELIIALVVLMVFLFAGQTILKFLGLEESSLSIAGGVILFLIALNMVFPNRGLHNEPEKEDPFIVPLAVPLISRTIRNRRADSTGDLAAGPNGDMGRGAFCGVAGHGGYSAGQF